MTTEILPVLLILTIIFICIYFRNPFKYPYMRIDFDVSGKRNPDIVDYIDLYIIENKLDAIIAHEYHVRQWKEECIKNIIPNSFFKEMREQQFQSVIDDEYMFQFSFYRKQTHYKQVNYVKHPYEARAYVTTYSCCSEFLRDRYNKLKAIEFECPLSEYYCKDQRKRMTPELRKQIAIRDNYTCKMCGKYMPDGVGLQIDHIIPISKGGKSIPSNLQVLCSKCNGRKSNRM